MEKINPPPLFKKNNLSKKEGFQLPKSSKKWWGVKKAVIPIAGLGTRFLPLTKVLSKELWPVVDKPMIQYIVEEAVNSGIKKIVFVTSLEKKEVLDYFKKYLKKMPELKEILKMRKKNHLLKELKNLEKISKKVSFSYTFQKEPLGDGHAILQTKKIIKNEPCAVLFSDDLVESKIPCLLQLIRVFKKYQKPIISLYRLPKERLPFYGVVGVKKIKGRLYQIKKIIEKPKISEAPSNLAIVGKYIITPEVFDYLKKNKVDKKREIILANTLNKMIDEGLKVYGYEFEGKWLECGNKLAYLKTNFYLSLKHPQFGKELKKFLRTW